MEIKGQIQNSSRGERGGAVTGTRGGGWGVSVDRAAEFKQQLEVPPASAQRHLLTSNHPQFDSGSDALIHGCLVFTALPVWLGTTGSVSLWTAGRSKVTCTLTAHVKGSNSNRPMSIYLYVLQLWWKITTELNKVYWFPICPQCKSSTFYFYNPKSQSHYFNGLYNQPAVVWKEIVLFVQRHGDSAYFCDKLHVIELHVDN